MKNRNAFSLVELSVVIVIISILVSTVIVSRSLVDMAKINKIKEEAIMFNNSINIYFTSYGCLPGDCKQSQVPDLVSGINLACFTTNSPYQKCTDPTGCPGAIPLNTGSIETVAKTTCMMQSLQSAGYISGVNKNAILTDSIAGINLPITKFNKLAAWDFRLFPPQNIANIYPPDEFISGITPVPMEFNSLVNAGLSNKNVLLLRQATTIVGQAGNIAKYDKEPQNMTQTYGISANLTQKLDLKFDDGKPYSGNIMAGVNYYDFIENDNGSSQFNLNPGNFAPISCTTINVDHMGWSIYPISTNEKYLTSKNINRGCIVGFYMDIPT
jgi:prepilin-type N-terminal cleavage/methylation domain-containing protein